MARYEYFILDVFTDRIFGGNQLAVFPDARGLSGAQMQKVARELNLSETTFLAPPQDPANTRAVRIFTPARELPFAGHPTLGTAHALVTSGLAEGPRIVLEEGVGPVAVTVRRLDEARSHATLSVERAPEYGPPPPSVQALAELLSCAPEDIAADQPVQAVSFGVPFLFVPIRGLEAMARLKPAVGSWARHLGGWWAEGVFAFTRRTERADIDIHARMFAPTFGIEEDPATGAAAAALAGYLGAQEGDADGVARWRVAQGVEMGRPSLLEVEAVKRGGAVVGARVGGASVSVGQGWMEVPHDG